MRNGGKTVQYTSAAMRHASNLPDPYKTVVMRMARLALEHLDVSELFRQTTAIVAQTVGADFCKILELLPGGENFLLRAGVGWREGLVGATLIPAGGDTHVGRALLTGAPVVVEDLGTESRFRGPSILHDHGITSGVSLVIPGAEPFGVLAVHTRARRSFSVVDLEFLEAVAEILGLAIHRQGTHDAVSKSEETFRRTFDDSPIGMTLGSLDHRFLRANRAICKLLGYSEEEFKQLTFDQITHPDDLERTRELAGNLFRGEIAQFQLEKRDLAKSGEAVWIRLTATLIRDDQGIPLHAVGMIEDLTGQRQRERTVRLVRFTLDHAQEAIAWNGPDGRIVDANESLCRVLGYPRQELLSLRVPDVDATIPAESWPEVWREFCGRGSLARESRFRRKDGMEIPVEISVTYLEHDGAQYACTIARDITERKGVAAELEAREARYRALFENAGAMVSTMDMEGNITAVNKAMESFCGWPREELLGRNVTTLVPARYRDLIRSMRERKLRGGGTTAYDFELLTKDGLRRPVRMTSSVIEENGKVIGTHGIAIDISEQQMAHEVLRQSEEHFRALIENASDLVAVLAGDGTVLYVSPSIERMLGYKASERIGNSSFDIIHPDDAAAVRKAIALGRGMPGGAVTVEFRSRHKDGSWRSMEARARDLLDNPAVSGIVVNSRDITERKRSEEWFRNSFHEAGIGTAITSLDGRWLQVNPALCRFLGYSDEELLARRWQDVTLPDDVSASDEARERLLTGVAPSFQLEKRYVHKSGRPLWAYLSSSLMRDNEGWPRAFTMQIVDITQRKEAEEALHRTQAELRALAARLIGNEEEEHRSLARDLHDDFSQRLTALGFDLAALDAACPANISAKFRKRLHTAETSVAVLSDDLRQLAHQLHPSAIGLLGLPLALRELCRDASKRWSFSVRLRTCRLSKSLPQDAALCLYRVAQEALRNAAKHAKGDKVAVTLSRVDHGVQLSVSDNGIGFDAATAASTGGLGLISIRERVRLAGGSLTIKSRLGYGTQLSVVVPMPARPSGPGALTRKRVRGGSRT
jgi:PAS domain S-box-containing protein